MEGKEKITVVGMLGTAHKRRGWRRKNEGGEWGVGGGRYTHACNHSAYMITNTYIREYTRVIAMLIRPSFL